ncbi:MAG: polysaccharide biosynthesis tyrosine autokinase [Marmoricola sp.]
MTLSAYIRVLRKRWRTVALVTLAIVIAAVAITLLLPKNYAAQSTSFVSIASAQDGTPDALYQNSQYALNQVQSYPDIVTSPAVLGPVIDDLGLDMSVQELKAHVTATNPINTVLLNIQATSGSPKQAQAIANSVADHLGSLVETLETPQDTASSPVKVTTAVPAALPLSPASPRPALNVALGLLLGLGLGAVLAAVRERLDTTVKSLADLQDLTGSNPLGAIRRDDMVNQNPLLLTRPHSVALEEFRTIRTALRYVDVDHPPRQIVVSSAVPGEGKSILACNIALIMAQDQMSVCLVEADLRRPRATRYLGLDGSIGLTEVVAGERDLDEVLISWNRGQLTLLPAGVTPPDPGHLLGSKAMTELLARLRSRFDLVLIDAPPLLPVSDAAILGAMSDGVILVARHGHVAKEQIRHAMDSLHDVDARLIGTVLNATPAKEREARYGSDYAYASDDVESVGLHLKTNV